LTSMREASRRSLIKYPSRASTRRAYFMHADAQYVTAHVIIPSKSPRAALGAASLQRRAQESSPRHARAKGVRIRVQCADRRCGLADVRDSLYSPSLLALRNLASAPP
jgi:hypothetical protein